MTSLRILYDGWPLCHEPNSPAALHLLAILAYLPEHIQPVIALPATPPPWIPSQVQTHLEPTPTEAHLQWEQRALPQLRQQLDAHLLHLTTETASLLNGTHTVISPTRSGDLDTSHGKAHTGLVARLRGALAAGGTTRVRALFWPEDLPSRTGRQVISIPPIVHPDFVSEEWEDSLQIPGIELPETYVLYHGPDDDTSLGRALRAWTWAAGPVGMDFPLVMLGLGKKAVLNARRIADELNIQDTIQVLPAISPAWIPALYRCASVIFHPATVSAWGGAVRHGLACGKPVVAAETEWASAMVGPAAILVEPEDTRRLGGSVIGTIVKEELFTRLREAAIERSKIWRDALWGEKLAKAYSRLIR